MTILWLRFRRNKASLAALAFVTLLVLAAIFAPWISPYDPNHQDYAAAWSPPTREHWFGADDLGRDLLTRLIYGGRVSLSVGALVVLAQLVIGLPVGAITGLRGGWIDFVFGRVVDIISSVPTILFNLLLVLVLGRGFINVIIALSATGWVGIARLVRGQVLSLRATDYVRAARGMGANTTHIITQHLIRNALTPVLVAMTYSIPAAMMAEAGISYLGMGITPPMASWGQIVGQFQGYIQTIPHLAIIPSILLSLTLMSFYVLADGVRDAMDPTIQV
jgi:ABC-type dipeptide/oligopeptide/nickel transport system permease subunit